MPATPEDDARPSGQPTSRQQSGATLSLFDHDSSNFLLSPALTADPDSRPVSGILSLPPPPPTNNFRDSVISIIDDPFFQSLRDVAARSERGNSEDERETWEWDEGCDRVGEAPGLDAGAGGASTSTNYSRPRRTSHIRGESQTIGQFQAATDPAHWVRFVLTCFPRGSRTMGRVNTWTKLRGCYPAWFPPSYL